MTIEKKFHRGDIVSVHPEALEGLEHLFPEGFSTFNGTVSSERLDYRYTKYPEKEDIGYIYTVRMDQDPSVPNLQFVDKDLTRLISADIVALDKVIARMEANLEALRIIRNNQATYREKD